MWAFWGHTIEPLLDAGEARNVVEVGSEHGRTTKLLLARAERVEGIVHAIDPAPSFDVERTTAEHGDRFQFHRALSVEVLGELGGLDAALIDGDHNWHTVHTELELLAGRADADRAPMPLVVAHDVGWPYGRRDMYYDPATVPERSRQRAAQKGVLPGRSELGEPGLNASLWNATHEGGERNGVLTAIEDFVAKRPERCELVVIPGWHGLAVLATEARLRGTPALAPAVERLRSAEYLREQAERLELTRIQAGVMGGAAARTKPDRQA